MTGTKSFNNMICVNHATEQMKWFVQEQIFQSMCSLLLSSLAEVKMNKLVTVSDIVDCLIQFYQH